MRIYPLLISLLLSGLFLPSGSQAQTAEVSASEPTGPISIEPDSVTRHTYSKTRIRSVTKVLLNDQGETQDTVSYQEVDTQGRFTLVQQRPTSISLANMHNRPQLHKQWSYDTLGHCTSLVIHPSDSRPYTVVYTYNPKLGRGLQQVIKSNGSNITMSELALRQHGDTVITEKVTHAIVMQGLIFNQKSQHRMVRYTPHPDTVLLIHYKYNEKGKLLTAVANYSLSQQGQVRETGILDMVQAIKRHSMPMAASGQATSSRVYNQLVEALRHRQAIYPKMVWNYDNRNRLVQQEIKTLDVRFVNHLTVNVKHTYNSQNQLIASEQSSPRFGQSYTLYSYSPTGLLTGETTNARSPKPLFYRYLYQFYE